MLKLKNITKIYKTGSLEQKALNNVSLSFKKGEFVSILGPSGCGKTTMLNIIGGLDRYTSGDLQISGKSTKDFKSNDWDSYRNNSIGFVFQSYNLISHISVIDNVEMSMTLSGRSKKERRDKALGVLERVGLSDHIHKKPNQLSGGQKQRVAIARALANDPEIILADEPTGALDSKTSVEIMELIKEISKDNLVIMVTHNAKLANEYSSRVVRLKDGMVIEDSATTDESIVLDTYKPKKTSMSFLTALKLSFNNLKTKFGRTLIVGFAGSIGIIGVSLVLSLSNGMNTQIGMLESDQLSALPITIDEHPTNIVMGPPAHANGNEDEIEIDESGVLPFNKLDNTETHRNNISEELISYIKEMDESLGTTQYRLGVTLNVLNKTNDNVTLVPKGGSFMGSTYGFIFSELPEDQQILIDNYEIVSGQLPSNPNQLLMIVDEYNRLDDQMLSLIGYEINNGVIDFSEIIGKKLVIAKNDDFYTKLNNTYIQTSDLNKAYDNGFKLEIVGVVRPIVTEENNNEGMNALSSVLSTGIWYTNELTDSVLEDSINSNISKEQFNSDINLLTGREFNENSTKEDVLKKLGAITTPVGIDIYPNNFESKEKITEYIDNWNTTASEEDEIVYTDAAKAITSMMNQMIEMIKIVLVSFAGISLVVSTIMIGIITYVSVLERTKEIGVLRALGARKKDISRVFNAETFIVGLLSGSLGIALTYLLSFPLNNMLGKLMSVDNIVEISYIQSVGLIVISIILTLVSGLIPARIASKKDPVVALRTE